VAIASAFMYYDVITQEDELKFSEYNDTSSEGRVNLILVG